MKPPVKTYSGGKPNYVQLSSSTELIIWYRSTDRLPGYGEPVMGWTDAGHLVVATLEGEPVENLDDDRVWWVDADGYEILVAWWAEIKGPVL